MKGKKEISYGIIPLTYRENYWEIFLVQHLHGNHWGFPKGHSEKGESPKQTAERELIEETSMTVIRYLSPSFLEEKYQFKRNGHLIDKTVHFYLAEVTPKYFIQSKEIIQGRWIPLKDLFSYTTFPEDQQLCHSLIKMLEKQK